MQQRQDSAHGCCALRHHVRDLNLVSISSMLMWAGCAAVWLLLQLCCGLMLFLCLLARPLLLSLLSLAADALPACMFCGLISYLPCSTRRRPAASALPTSSTTQL